MNELHLRELVDFKNQLHMLMIRSDSATKLACESLDTLDKSTISLRSKCTGLFEEIRKKQTSLTNTYRTIEKMEKLLQVVDIVTSDRLKILTSSNELKNSSLDFINKLELLKEMENYSWISTLDMDRVRIVAKRERNLETCYNHYKQLMFHGESMLAEKFLFILRYYSNDSQMYSFFDFLLNEFQNSAEPAATSRSSKSNSDSSVDAKQFLYISNEDLNEMEKISTWFLERERQYELYDDQNQHCDIHGKLKYTKVRFDYVKECLIIYFKMSSLGFKKILNEKFKENLGKMITKVKTQSSKISSRVLETANSINESFTDSRHKSDDYPPDTNIDLINLDDMSLEVSNSQSSKPIEYLEKFSDGLTLTLKLLQHEHSLIELIFRNSEETRADLNCKLSIIFIDIIKKEFEKFFNVTLDFGKLQNVDDNALVLVIQLITQIHNLKEKTHSLQSDDLNSASRLLRFSFRINEISSQVFSTYLDTIKSGHFNEHKLPGNCSTHGFVVKVCNMWRLIIKNEKYLFESIRVICDSGDTESNFSSLKLIKVNALRDVFNKSRKINSHNEQDDEDDDEDGGKDIESEGKNYVRWRSKPSSVSEDNLDAGSELTLTDESDQKMNLTFSKYYSMIVHKLDKFLNEEANKYQSFNRLSFAASNLVDSSLRSFKSNLNNLKTCIFLANNQQYVVDFLNEQNLIDNLNRINPNFENEMYTSIENTTERACDVFKYMNERWSKSMAAVNSDIQEQQETGGDARNSNEEHNKQTGSFKKLISNVKSQTKKPVFRIGKMKERNKEFISMLHELISTSLQIVIENMSLNALFKQKTANYIYDVLYGLESTGELLYLIESLNLKIDPNEDNKNLTDIIINQMFPSKIANNH